MRANKRLTDPGDPRIVKSPEEARRIQVENERRVQKAKRSKKKK